MIVLSLQVSSPEVDRVLCSVSLAEATLQAAVAHADRGLLTSCTDIWCQLATAAIAQLHAACKSHPDPRKVFKTVATRLLAPILKLEIDRGEPLLCWGTQCNNTQHWPRDPVLCPSHACKYRWIQGPCEAATEAMGCAGEGAAGRSSWRALVHAARQLLDAVLFSKDHIGHIQELASASWTGIAHDHAERGEAGKHTALLGAEGALPALRAPRHGKYAALPFEVSDLLSAMPAMPSTLWAHASQASDRQAALIVGNCTQLLLLVEMCIICSKACSWTLLGYEDRDSSECNKLTGMDC